MDPSDSDRYQWEGFLLKRRKKSGFHQRRIFLAKFSRRALRVPFFLGGGELRLLCGMNQYIRQRW